MSFTLNCCEGFKIKNLFCFCDKDDDNLMYADSNNELYVINSPNIKIPDFINYEFLDEHDIYMFSHDKDGFMRFCVAQGPNSAFTIEDVKEENPRKSIRKVDATGLKIEEVLPNNMRNLLIPIYEQTLTGHHMQLTTMWRGSSKVLRTFPIKDHRKKVVAGFSIFSPVHSHNIQVNKFILNDHKKDKPSISVVQN